MTPAPQKRSGLRWAELPIPTASGVLIIVGAVVILITGARLHSIPLTMMGSILFGLLAASAYLAWRGVQRATVDRDTTLRGQVGHPVPFRLKVRAPRSFGGFLIAKDRNFGVRPALVPTKGGEYDGSWLLMLTQRGRWTELRTVLACSMPTGLFVAKREFRAPGDIEIGPATTEIELPEILSRVEGAGERKSHPPKAGRGIDYMNIRSYRSGDRIRHIHWRASARHDELLVREFEAEGHATLLVALDTQGIYTAPTATPAKSPLGIYDVMTVTPAAPSVSLGDFAGERAVSVAASISIAALHEGNVVYLLSGSQGLVKARSREEAMSYWAKVSFGPTPPVTRKLTSLPPNVQIAAVGTQLLLPYLTEIPPDGAAFIVGPPTFAPVPTWFVPLEGPIWFLPQAVAA